MTERLLVGAVNRQAFWFMATARWLFSVCAWMDGGEFLLLAG